MTKANISLQKIALAPGEATYAIPCSFVAKHHASQPRLINFLLPRLLLRPLPRLPLPLWADVPRCKPDAPVGEPSPPAATSPAGQRFTVFTIEVEVGAGATSRPRTTSIRRRRVVAAGGQRVRVQ